MSMIDKKLAKKSKKKQKKIAKQEQSAAIAAAQWTPRPDSGKDRPTPERLAKGDFRLIDGEDAGVTVAVDSESTLLDVMVKRGLITRKQAQAGHDFAALIDRTRIVSQGRSCLNFDPVGHDGDAEPTHAELRDQQERAEVFLACGTATFAELRRTCCDGRRPLDMERLKRGLNLCVALWS